MVAPAGPRDGTPNRGRPPGITQTRKNAGLVHLVTSYGFGDLAFAEVRQRLARLDAGMLYFDVRPSARYETLEFRVRLIADATAEPA